MTLAQRLHDTRKLADVPGADLGTWAGLSKGTVSMIESGNRADPSGSTVEKLARALGVSTDYLLSGKGAAPSKKQVVAAVAAAKAAWEKENAA